MNVLQQKKKKNAVLVMFYPSFALTQVKIVKGFFESIWVLFVTSFLQRPADLSSISSPAALGFASCYNDYLSSQDLNVSCD